MPGTQALPRPMCSNKLCKESHIVLSHPADVPPFRTLNMCAQSILNFPNGEIALLWLPPNLPSSPSTRHLCVMCWESPLSYLRPPLSFNLAMKQRLRRWLATLHAKTRVLRVG